MNETIVTEDDFGTHIDKASESVILRLPDDAIKGRIQSFTMTAYVVGLLIRTLQLRLKELQELKDAKE